MNDVLYVIQKACFVVERRWPFGENVGLGQVLSEKASECNHFVVIVGCHFFKKSGLELNGKVS